MHHNEEYYMYMESKLLTHSTIHLYYLNSTVYINEKMQFIHCVNSHASKTAKIIKRWDYPSSRSKR